MLSLENKKIPENINYDKVKNIASEDYEWFQSIREHVQIVRQYTQLEVRRGTKSVHIEVVLYKFVYLFSFWPPDL